MVPPPLSISVAVHNVVVVINVVADPVPKVFADPVSNDVGDHVPDVVAVLVINVIADPVPNVVG